MNKFHFRKVRVHEWQQENSPGRFPTPPPAVACTGIATSRQMSRDSAVKIVIHLTHLIGRNPAATTFGSNEAVDPV
jgi:hypothetical protein